MAITVIASERKVRDFLVYDFEWVPGSLQIRLCGCYDERRGYRCYHSVDAFLENEMVSSNRGKWFYAHAGGLADIQFIFEKFVDDPEYKVRASTSGSSVIICHVRKGKNVWHFVDSYWLLRASLETIGKWIGKAKGMNVSGWETMSKADKRRWYEEASFIDLRTYNERDCEILWHAIAHFQAEILELGGQLQMTQASTAMHLFRRRFLSRDIPTSRQINELARNAYVASRVEVFESEATMGANYYDINSSFPHSMTAPQPGLLKGISQSLPDHGLYLARLQLRVPDMYMPPLPIRMKGRIFFPIGRWEAWLTSVDVELLLREGGIIEKVYEVLHFEPFDDLRAYNQEIYQIKKKADKEGDTFKREVAKLLMNSLYGKFAECPIKQMIHINPDQELFDSGRIARGEYLIPGVYVEKREIMIPHAHVPISVHITALSRRLIYDYMQPCLNRGVHYCDTDGFSTGANDVACGEEIGELKREGQEIKRGWFIAPKVYLLEGMFLNKGKWEWQTKVKAKGFSLGKGAEAIEAFERLRAGEQIEVERMTRVMELFRKGKTAPRESKITKQLRMERSITKRMMYPDGKSRPWHIRELESFFR